MDVASNPGDKSSQDRTMEQTMEQSPDNGEKRESSDSYRKYLKTGNVEDLRPFVTVVQNAKDHDSSIKNHVAN